MMNILIRYSGNGLVLVLVPAPHQQGVRLEREARLLDCLLLDGDGLVELRQQRGINRQRRLADRELALQFEQPLLALVVAGVNQRVERAGIDAALALHHHGGLAGVSRILRDGAQAVVLVLGYRDRVADVLGQRGLAGARVSEQPEDLVRRALVAVVEPVTNRVERLDLLCPELHQQNPFDLSISIVSAALL
jgi:hypothetical protein